MSRGARAKRSCVIYYAADTCIWFTRWSWRKRSNFFSAKSTVPVFHYTISAIPTPYPRRITRGGSTLRSNGPNCARFVVRCNVRYLSSPWTSRAGLLRSLSRMGPEIRTPDLSITPSVRPPARSISSGTDSSEFANNTAKADDGSDGWPDIHELGSLRPDCDVTKLYSPLTIHLECSLVLLSASSSRRSLHKVSTNYLWLEYLSWYHHPRKVYVILISCISHLPFFMKRWF